MFKYLTPLSFAAAMALTAAPVMAQNTAVTQLDLGERVSTDPQLGERYAKDKFGDWNLACIKTEAEKDPCSLLQIMKDKQNKPVAEMSVFRLGGEGQAVAGATIIVPLEVLLAGQITISIDGAPGKRYNFSFCNPIGCIAQIGLTEGDILAFKKGKKATVSVVPAPAPDQIISLPLSLKGFSEGYEVVDIVADQ